MKTNTEKIKERNGEKMSEKETSTEAIGVDLRYQMRKMSYRVRRTGRLLF